MSETNPKTVVTKTASTRRSRLVIALLFAGGLASCHHFPLNPFHHRGGGHHAGNGHQSDSRGYNRGGRSSRNEHRRSNRPRRHRY